MALELRRINTKNLLKNYQADMDIISIERVLELETAIMTSKGDVQYARSALLRYLRSTIESENQGKGSSIASLLELGSRTTVTSELACVTIRCMAVDGLIPDKSASANITRSIVDICEAGASKVCKFIHLDASAQTYEKIITLSRAHAELTRPLYVMTTPFADLSSIMKVEHQVTGALNHGVMSFYCNFFGLADIKKIVDEIYSKVRNVTIFGQGLVDDMQTCRDVLQSARTIAIESSTFISMNYLLPFVINIENAITDLESSLKERFSTKVTLASGHQLTKRYPLHESGRRLRVVVPLTNEGPGKLVGLQASVAATDGFSVDNEKIIMGDVTPGRFAIVVDGEVTRPIDDCEVLVDLGWNEIGSPVPKSEIFEIRVLAQTTTVDWKAIQFWAPYSTEPANGSEFVGRGEKVRQVASKILRTPMEPFYITGQKRVGKTSLALAAVAFAQENAESDEIKSQYILWGDVAYQDPHRTMYEIGSVFEDALRRYVDLREFDAIDCSDSLAPLVKLCHRAFEKDQKKKFVFIMDEFDEVHPEMYLHGTLAETFFANIRALTKCRNVCVVLIGGENMPYVMDRQGQKLNNFSRVSLNYYSRELEWDDYNLLVRSATVGVIDWHDDAIAELFNITNGNPYFTKIACAAVLRQAISERDADVTYEEVRRVVFDEISSLGANYFAHLWQDGIPKPVEDREPEILVRVRVLVAIANCLRRGSELSIENISSAQGSRDLMGVGVGAVLNDFVRREVLDIRDNRYRFLLPIFGSWLEDVGASALVETSLSKELADAVLGAEEAAMVKADEIARLVKHWPTYRGRHVGSEEVRSWLSQVASLRQQRILFKILQNLHFFTDVFIRERLATLHNVAVLPHLETLVQKRRSDKRRDVVVTYVDGEGKSGQTYASYYAEQNLIAGECICPPGEFGARYAKLVNDGIQVRYIVIVDDLAATGRSLSDNVRAFVERNGSLLQSDGLSVLVCTVAATQKASDYISRSFSEYGDINIGFRSAEFLVEKDYAFAPGNGIWGDDIECDVARTLCVDLGIGIYGRKNPLGFGNLGILAVFPNSVPNNTLPILHSPSRAGAVVPWAPLFQRIVH